MQASECRFDMLFSHNIGSVSVAPAGMRGAHPLSLSLLLERHRGFGRGFLIRSFIMTTGSSELN